MTAGGWMALALFVPLALLPARGFSFQCDRSDVWSAIGRILLPDVLTAYHDLRGFLTTLPPLPSDSRAHLARVDDLFLDAVRLTEGNLQEALLVSSAATLPYRRFPMMVPVFQWPVLVPVSTESEECFTRRFRNLPSRIFLDSPSEGDRDKLVHFFGSAFLHLHLKSAVFTREIGNIVEDLELWFKLDGSRDPRDLRVNQLGIDFANALMLDEDTLPSRILRHQTLTMDSP